ncbi:MAG: hypothetical protein J5574_00040 [Lachnospiraceae bacterium]|nr:hypothetical protein [Lachnospiraceae bacterium]
MKGFGKFITFVGVTGAALAGLWYFCEMNKDKCECSCDGDEGSADNKAGERSYVSLDPEIKDAAENIKESVADGKDTLKKAVKSAAQDIMAKAEDAAKGVGLVKDGKKPSDFEFEDFDKAAKKAKKAVSKAADEVTDAVKDAASHIDIQ